LFTNNFSSGKTFANVVNQVGELVHDWYRIILSTPSAEFEDIDSIISKMKEYRDNCLHVSQKKRVFKIKDFHEINIKNGSSMIINPLNDIISNRETRNASLTPFQKKQTALNFLATLDLYLKYEAKKKRKSRKKSRQRKSNRHLHVRY